MKENFEYIIEENERSNENIEFVDWVDFFTPIMSIYDFNYDLESIDWTNKSQIQKFKNFILNSLWENEEHLSKFFYDLIDEIVKLEIYKKNKTDQIIDNVWISLRDIRSNLGINQNSLDYLIKENNRILSLKEKFPEFKEWILNLPEWMTLVDLENRISLYSKIKNIINFQENKSNWSRFWKKWFYNIEILNKIMDSLHTQEDKKRFNDSEITSKLVLYDNISNTSYEEKEVFTYSEYIAIITNETYLVASTFWNVDNDNILNNTFDEEWNLTEYGKKFKRLELFLWVLELNYNDNSYKKDFINIYKKLNKWDLDQAITLTNNLIDIVYEELMIFYNWKINFDENEIDIWNSIETDSWLIKALRYIWVKQDLSNMSLNNFWIWRADVWNWEVVVNSWRYLLKTKDEQWNFYLKNLDLDYNINEKSEKSQSKSQKEIEVEKEAKKTEQEIVAYGKYGRYKRPVPSYRITPPTYRNDIEEKSVEWKSQESLWTYDRQDSVYENNIEEENISSIDYKVKSWDTLWNIVKNNYWFKKNNDIVNIINKIIDFNKWNKNLNSRFFKESWAYLQIWNIIKLPEYIKIWDLKFNRKSN